MRCWSRKPGEGNAIALLLESGVGHGSVLHDVELRALRCTATDDGELAPLLSAELQEATTLGRSAESACASATLRVESFDALRELIGAVCAASGAATTEPC